MEVSNDELKILKELYEVGKPLSIHEISLRLHIPDNRVKKLVKSLERKNLIRKIPWHYVRSRTGRIISKVPNKCVSRKLEYLVS